MPQASALLLPASCGNTPRLRRLRATNLPAERPGPCGEHHCTVERNAKSGGPTKVAGRWAPEVGPGPQATSATSPGSRAASSTPAASAAVSARRTWGPGRRAGRRRRAPRPSIPLPVPPAPSAWPGGRARLRGRPAPPGARLAPPGRRTAPVPPLRATRPAGSAWPPGGPPLSAGPAGVPLGRRPPGHAPARDHDHHPVGARLGQLLHRPLGVVALGQGETHRQQGAGRG